MSRVKRQKFERVARSLGLLNKRLKATDSCKNIRGFFSYTERSVARSAEVAEYMKQLLIAFQFLD